MKVARIHLVVVRGGEEAEQGTVRKFVPFHKVFECSHHLGKSGVLGGEKILQALADVFRGRSGRT